MSPFSAPRTRTALALLPALAQPAVAIHKEIFTTNAVCTARNCVNPVFPGLEDLYTLARENWSCQTIADVAPTLTFCSGVVNYNPSLPVPTANKTVAELVQEQEQRAITTYFMHLNAMGLEGWDYTQPQSGADPCSEAIWRMACYTYFPKTPRNCAKDTQAKYLRPCASSCANYVKQCGVECCDESVQCSFEHSRRVNTDTIITTNGYAPHEGPSMFCTGNAATKSMGGLLFLLFGYFLLNFDFPTIRIRPGRVGVLLSVVALLSVCATPVSAVSFEGHSAGAVLDMHEEHGASHYNETALIQFGAKAKTTAKEFDIPGSHQVGNWRAKEDYLIKFQYVPPGSTSAGAILNSCSLSNLAQTLQCSGRGMCKPFNPYDIANPVNFCECDRDYADPECRTKRRSQATAYVLSLFLGILGVDKFYLGFPVQGAAKLVSFGGFGVWWVIDIVYIGSAPVYAAEYRVAANLPHWTFVISSISFFLLIGFCLAGCVTARHMRHKRRSALLFQAEEDAQAGEFAGLKSQHSMLAPQPQVSFPPA